MTAPVHSPLPVTISVGLLSVEAGTIHLDPDKPVGPQLADFLVGVADVCRAVQTDPHEDEDQEVSTDAAP
ncbi:hypothetical protein ACFUGD_06620 [Streptomyces sp. NPDC057217]|uniref:hypothetical protein n=1 Tax=Streptomyces sp. NPDC057217 TaxID=3346054 RepID=UPI00363A070C